MPESAERPHPSAPWWAGGANGLDECSGKRTHELELEGDQHSKEWSSMGKRKKSCGWSGLGRLGGIAQW